MGVIFLPCLPPPIGGIGGGGNFLPCLPPPIGGIGDGGNFETPYTGERFFWLKQVSSKKKNCPNFDRLSNTSTQDEKSCKSWFLSS